MTQLRAILRASAYGPASWCRCWPTRMRSGRRWRSLSGPRPNCVRRRSRTTTMCRSVAWSKFRPPCFAGLLHRKHLDFLSIGTNDLIQYTLAIDRTDDAVAHMYDPLHPAVLKLIAQAIRTANKANTPIAVCGEMAGELRLTRLLLGFGLRNFSMHPAQLLTIKRRVLTSSIADCEAAANRILRTDDPDKIAAALVRLNAL